MSSCNLCSVEKSMKKSFFLPRGLASKLYKQISEQTFVVNGGKGSRNIAHASVPFPNAH